MNPEAIVEIPPAPWALTTPIELLSDNGTTVYYGDTIEAKHLPYPAFKKFRNDWIQMGQVVKPAPFIKSIKSVSGNVTVTWRALQGETYRLQSATSLPGQNWTDMAGDVIANGPIASKTFSLSGTPRFYKVKILP